MDVVLVSGSLPQNLPWKPPSPQRLYPLDFTKSLYFSKNRHSPSKLKQYFTDLERLAAGLMISRADINDRIERYGRLLTAIEENSDLYAADSPL
jgi:hypothetical protein